MEKDAVILWFGRHIIVSVGDANAQFHDFVYDEKQDPARTIVDELLKLDSRPTRVRLLYQPSDLEFKEEADVAGSTRSDMRETLAANHTELRNETIAWATSRVPTADKKGNSTLLWVDTQQRLPRLKKTLADKNIRLVGAWPLVSVLETVDPTNTPNRAALAVILTDAGAFLYQVTGTGSRRASFVSGFKHPDKVNESIRTMLGTTKPPTLVVEATTVEWTGGLPAGITPTRLTMEELMQAAYTLKVTSPSNFLPQEIILYADRLVFWSTAAAAALFVILAASYAWRYHSLTVSGKEQAKQAVEMNKTRDHFVENKRVIETADQWAAEVKWGRGGHLALLQTIMDNRMPELTLHSLTITDKNFTIEGTEHEGVGTADQSYNKFLKALVTAGTTTGGVRWTVTTKDGVLSKPEFTIEGTYQ